MDVNEMNRSIASMYCDRCDTLKDDMENNLVGILKRLGGYVLIEDDDITTTVYDNGYPFILHIKELRCIDDSVFMVGILTDNMDSEYTSWDANTIENYYQCLQFLKGEGK